MVTHKQGIIGEAKILTKLMELGYNVLVPFNKSLRYDLVYEIDGIFKRIQVKSRSIIDGIIRVELYSSYRGSDGSIKKRYTKDEIDEVLIYCPDNDKIYKVLMTDLEEGQFAVWLRVDEEKAVSRSRMAKDYEIQ